MFGGSVSHTAMTSRPPRVQASVAHGFERRQVNDSAMPVMIATFAASGPSRNEFAARSTIATAIRSTTNNRSITRQLASLTLRRRRRISSPARSAAAP
jgi:hypothetical protein